MQSRVKKKKIKAIISENQAKKKKKKSQLEFGPIYAYRQTMRGNLITDRHLDHQVSISLLFLVLLTLYTFNSEFIHLPPSKTLSSHFKKGLF